MNECNNLVVLAPNLEQPCNLDVNVYRSTQTMTRQLTNETNISEKSKKRNKLFDVRMLYDMRFSSIFRLRSISSSPMIRGECAFLVDNTNDIFIINESLSRSAQLDFDRDQTSLIRLSTSSILDSLSPSNSSNPTDWRSVLYGSQPRELLYADSQCFFSLDARIKSSSYPSKLLFDARHTNELIARVNSLETDFNCFLICTSKRMILKDERYATRPLLEWPHHLKSSPKHLCTIDLSLNRFMGQQNKSNYAHMSVISDSKEIYMNQFSTKLHEMPIVHNLTLKCDDPLDIGLNYAKNYDRCLDRALESRLKEPIISLEMLKFSNSFALFQVSFNFPSIFNFDQKKGILNPLQKNNIDEQ